MHYRAILQIAVKETQHSEIEHLAAGEFLVGKKYSTFRSQGTRDWLLLLTVGGGGRVVCRNSEVLARRGCVTLYQPRAPQHYFTDPDVGEWHLHWCHFHPRPHWREWLNWEEPTKGFRTLLLHDDELIRNIGTALGDAMHLSRQRIQGCTDLALNALERAILLIHSANLHPELDARIRKALQLLAEKMRDPFSLPELAKGCGLSVSRLAHLFREQLGDSPQKYQEQLRLLSAAHLLRSTGLTITEVACELGYSSPFYFTRRFIKYFQESPSSYRCRRLSGEHVPLHARRIRAPDPVENG